MCTHEHISDIKPALSLCDVVTPLLEEIGLNRFSLREWRRKLAGKLIALERTGDGTWWLTVVCAADEPSLEFSGGLGSCIMQYAAVAHAVQAGVFGGN